MRRRHHGVAGLGRRGVGSASILSVLRRIGTLRIRPVAGSFTTRPFFGRGCWLGRSGGAASAEVQRRLPRAGCHTHGCIRAGPSRRARPLLDAGRREATLEARRDRATPETKLHKAAIDATTRPLASRSTRRSQQSYLLSHSTTGPRPIRLAHHADAAAHALRHMLNAVDAHVKDVVHAWSNSRARSRTRDDDAASQIGADEKRRVARHRASAEAFGREEVDENHSDARQRRPLVRGEGLAKANRAYLKLPFPAVLATHQQQRPRSARHVAYGAPPRPPAGDRQSCRPRGAARRPPSRRLCASTTSATRRRLREAGGERRAEPPTRSAAAAAQEQPGGRRRARSAEVVLVAALAATRNVRGEEGALRVVHRRRRRRRQQRQQPGTALARAAATSVKSPPWAASGRIRGQR